MGLDTRSDCGSTKNLGVVSRVADYAQKPALHEGRGMIGRSRRQRTSRQSVPLKFAAACGKPTHIVPAAWQANPTKRPSMRYPQPENPEQ
jgi:hypothetical protein